MTRDSNDRFANLVVGLIVLGMIAAFVATVIDLDDGPRRGVFAMFAWLVLLLPIHEAGHALAARLVGATIRRFVLGYGPVLLRREIAGVDFVLHAFPVQGFVSLDAIDGLSRAARVFVYAAGVGAEAIAVGLALALFGADAVPDGPISVAHAITATGVAALAMSVFANLIPRTALLQPNGEGGEVNDGRRILEALASR